MRIFIADDSRAMRMIVVRQLRQAGFEDAEFIEAADGAEALAKAREHSPNLIVSDWNMPEVNGLEFLRQLRASGDDTVFGFVTSEGTPDMIQLARSNGASFLIAKPFTPETFRDTLNAVGVEL